MQLIKNKTKFDLKKTEHLLLNENKFIAELLTISAVPVRKDFEGEEELEETKPENVVVVKGTASRAKSLLELQQRLEAITSKKQLTYKDKLTKKVLKSRMKKKSKRDERNAQHKTVRAAKMIKTENGEQTAPEETAVAKPSKPVFNSEDKVVYSKFDFSQLGQKKEKKREKDPKKILQNLQKEKEKIQQLQASGETDKAIEMKEKTAWKNAIAKTEGQKIKDDPILLKKTVKKQKQIKKASKKKWEARLEGVEKGKEERQKKRTDNIEKRKKDKKNNKLKSASKRGRIIAGF